MMQHESSAARPVGGSGRTAVWVLVSVVVGFLLPVCSCGLLLFFAVVGLGALGGSGESQVLAFGDAVAIIPVEGAILSGDEDDLAAGVPSGVVIADLEQAAADPNVKAVVLRVDSPGGTVTGSAQIYEALLAFEKPVVVSMVGVAASGGYYISAPADFILARPDTVTGSIGVIYTLFNAEELIDELGVEVTTITSGPNKAFGSPWQELTPEQAAILDGLVAESYAEFIRVVAEGRGMSEDEVRALADGRIYSGRQALALGLVDELGNIEAAIDKAAELGGISGEPQVIEYEHLPSFSQLFGGFATRLGRSQADELMETIYDFTTPALEYRYVGPGQ